MIQYSFWLHVHSLHVSTRLSAASPLSPYTILPACGFGGRSVSFPYRINNSRAEVDVSVEYGGVKQILLFIFLFIQISAQSFAQDTIRLSTFGLKPNSRVNAVSFINKALALTKSKSTVLLFEKGRYDFWPDEATRKNYYESNTTIVNPRVCGIFIFKQHNLTLDGAGADFIFHSKMQPVTIDSSENITIKNFSVDWEIPFGAEAEITDVTETYFDLVINEQHHPYEIENNKLYFIGEGWKEMWGGVKWNDPIEFERETFMVTPETDDYLLGDDWEQKYTAQEISNGVVRIFYANNKRLKKGNYLNLRIGARDHAGVFMADSKNIQLQNINMHSNSGMNFLAQFTENISYKNVNCIPSRKRKVVAGHDDGLHHTNCKGMILVDGCSFRGIMDDAFNAHNTYVLVKEKLSTNKLLCQFRHHQSLGFVWGRIGEQVSFIKTQSMNSVGSATIKSYKILKPELFEIEFDSPIPPAITGDDALENITWNPSVEIKNCQFGQHRARAILASTPEKVWIHNNVFESSGAAICIPGDANHWYEGGAAKEVIISHNKFINCNTSAYQFSEAIICIQPGIPAFNATLPRFHKNIRITNNEFEVFDAAVIYAFSVEGLVINSNTIKRTTQFTPRNSNTPMFKIDACKKVEIIENNFDLKLLNTKIQLIRMHLADLKFDKNQNAKVINNK